MYKLIHLLHAFIAKLLKPWTLRNEFEKRFAGNIVSFLRFIRFDPYSVYERTSSEHEVYFRRLPYYKKLGAPIFNLVMIQTTSICNRKCHFCYYGIETNPEHVIMEDGLFKKIIKNLVDIDYKGKISLFEINEPFTDPQIVSRIEYAVESLPNAWHHLVTNGDLATFEQLVRVASLLNQLSICSYDKSSSERNSNYVAQLQKMNLKARINHGDSTTTAINFVSRGGHIKKYYTGNINGPFCEYVYQVMMITPKGEVISCWNDFYHRNIMGDINKSNLFEIWYGKEFAEYRARLSAGDRKVSLLCAQCDYTGYNQWFYPECIKTSSGEDEIVPRSLTFRYPGNKSLYLKVMSMIDGRLSSE